MRQMNRDCYWCAALGEACKILEEPVCQSRRCSFYETAGKYAKRQAAFRRLTASRLRRGAAERVADKSEEVSGGAENSGTAGIGVCTTCVVRGGAAACGADKSGEVSGGAENSGAAGIGVCTTCVVRGGAAERGADGSGEVSGGAASSGAVESGACTTRVVRGGAAERVADESVGVSGAENAGLHKTAAEASYAVGGSRVRNRPVICLETGRIFPDARQACIQYGLSARSLHKHLAGKRKACGGKHWRYAGEI